MFAHFFKKLYSQWSLFGYNHSHLRASQCTHGFLPLTVKTLHCNSWGLIAFFQGDPGGRWEEIFPDKPEIRSDNLQTKKSTSLLDKLLLDLFFLNLLFSLFHALSMKNWVDRLGVCPFLSPQMAFWVADRGLFACNCISLDRDLHAIVRIAEHVWIPHSKIARKKLAKAKSVIPKHLIWMSLYKTYPTLWGAWLWAQLPLVMAKKHIFRGKSIPQNCRVKYEWGPRVNICYFCKLSQNVLKIFLPSESLLRDWMWAKRMCEWRPCFPITVVRLICQRDTNQLFLLNEL